MLNLKEYREQPRSLADYLPYVALPFGQYPFVMAQKDGSLLALIRYRGPDLESTTTSVLVNYYAGLGTMLKHLGDRWAVHLIADRFYTSEYPDADWPCHAAALFDLERRNLVQGSGRQLESDYVLALTYLPPGDASSRLEGLLIEGEDGEREGSGIEQVDYFAHRVNEVGDMLRAFMPLARLLRDDDLLTFLHHPLGLERHQVAMPEVPMFLDSLLAEQPVWPGMRVGIGYTEDAGGTPRPERYLVTVGVRGYPSSTHAGMLDDLNSLGFEYRWSTRAITLGPQQSLRAVQTRVNRWGSQRKGLMTLIAEHVLREPSERVNHEAVARHADALAALQEVAEGLVSMAYVTPTITVWHENLGQALDNAKKVVGLLTAKHFIARVETFNAFEAWLGSLPGSCYANVRQPLVNTMNLAHLAPLSAVWAGESWNGELNGPALMRVITEGNTPFHFNFHHDDVGHSVIYGPTGAGKSVLLSSVALQCLRYPGARVYAFDKDRSIRLTTLCAGGRFHDIGAQGGTLGFQPLACIDAPAEVTWATEWLYDLFGKAGLELTPEQRNHAAEKLASLATSPVGERSLTVLRARLGDRDLKDALKPFCVGGAFGHLLDGDRDTLHLGRWQAFEMGSLLKQPSAAVPVMTYLFHRIEESLDGSPTLLIIDEGWRFLDDTTFAKKIEDWLLTLRKKKVAVIFTTQTISSIAKSKVAPIIWDNCLTRIYLPNAAANDPQTRGYYSAQGLNDRQVNLIANARRKRQYYYSSASGNRLFELGLGELGLALVGSSDPDDHKLADSLLASCGADVFLPAFLRAKGMDWAADMVDPNGVTRHLIPQAAE
ncbi:conjugal transfer protein TrbE (plasmid) [Skermanella rosea]|uniref:VirB4 family type IV secretion/conjugal transfer ATPase n=1 Tax=Skermanella rosea TaxID=1817965 RepID=UPI0019332A87|nr:conjugal transfer protein TrbE [Skermanella rosea]UEM06762.1 conjugal transfer protein TrbE [Skermanella rosea]